MATAPTTRQFNGLNGAEVRTRIVQEIDAALATDTRLAKHLVFPIVTWRWTLDLEVDPTPGQVLGQTNTRPEPGLHTEVRGRVSVASPPAARLILPDVSPDALSSSFTRLEPEAPARRESVLADRRGMRPSGEVPRPTEFPGPDEPVVAAGDGGGGAAVSLAAAVEDRFARLESLIGNLVDRVSAREPTANPGGADPTPVPPAQHVPVTGHHPDVTMRTGTGLPITGGARPSPGMAVAGSFGEGSPLGAVAPAEPPPGLLFGIEQKHPPLSQGGVGAPDAVRRAAGLPIPQAQATPDGGIVDLPAGTF